MDVTDAYYSKSIVVFALSSHVEPARVVDLVSAAVFDSLVVVLTVYRTGRTAFESRKSGIAGSLSFVFFWDGMCFYLLILCRINNFSQGMLYYGSVSVQYSSHSAQHSQ